MSIAEERRNQTNDVADERRSGSDRRAAARVPLPIPVDIEYPDRLGFTASLNVSPDGGFLAINPPHEEGVILNLRIQIPGKPEASKVQARTVSRVTDGEMVGNGVQFLGLDAAAGALIEELAAWQPS